MCLGGNTKGLVTNYREGGGGLQNRKGGGGGASEVVPLQKWGGSGKSLRHAEGVAQKVLR